MSKKYCEYDSCMFQNHEHYHKALESFVLRRTCTTAIDLKLPPGSYVVDLAAVKNSLIAICHTPDEGLVTLVIDDKLEVKRLVISTPEILREQENDLTYTG